MGSLKSPHRTSYRSSIKTIALNCLVFEKIAFLCMHFLRQAMEQSNKFCKKFKCNKSMLRYFNISVS